MDRVEEVTALDREVAAVGREVAAVDLEEEDLQGEDVDVILDENEVAKDMAYCDVGCVVPSPTQDLLAYSVDELCS